MCLICNYEWAATANSICVGSGCPKCSGLARLTNEILDEKLKNRLIIRIGNVNGTKNKIEFRCLIPNCNYKWKSTTNGICAGNGCPKCSNKIPLTNEVMDERLKDRSIKRIDNINGVFYKIKWECLVCNNEWEASANDICNSKSGCPLCKNKNEKLIYNLLKENDVKFERQKDIRILNINENRHCKVDFYFPDHNLIIEYNGHQHYRPVRFCGISQERAEANFIKQQDRDMYVRNFCKTNNIELLEIDGRECYGETKIKEMISHLIIKLTV